MVFFFSLLCLRFKCPHSPRPLNDSIDSLNPKDFILIKGARVNNLKNLSVAIPRNKLVVITGVSGSGKSSLAFDTLFAEGQRMYVESLSSYARQFLGRMEKPEVDYIKGVSPAIAIEQKVNTRNPRSTVGTTTEIYDYLKLLFARIGKTYSPISGQEVKRHTVTQVVEFIQSHPAGTRVLIACPLALPKGKKLPDELNLLLSKGFTRVLENGEVKQIEELLTPARKTKTKEKQAAPRYEVLIDRAVADVQNEEVAFRLADSVQTAFYEGQGECVVYLQGENGFVQHPFSDRFERDGMLFTEPSVNFFSFNNPYGACQTCEGFGKVLGIDEDLVIPDKGLSVYEGAIAPWRGEVMGEWLKPLIKSSLHINFPIHRPYADLTPEQKKLLWSGNEHFNGLTAFFRHLEHKVHKVQYRVMLSRFRGRTQCPDCQGSRLRKDAGYVKINGASIIDLVLMPVDECHAFFSQLALPPFEQQVAQRLLTEITFRLAYLQKVGLGYLTLNRLTGTLSGGEFQRIKLATALGSALVGSMYIMDEPSIGLHPKDTERMVEVLQSLRDLGNTVVVVEHEEEIMRAADHLIDIGPDAGRRGGELVFQGPVAQLPRNIPSHTVRFLTGEEKIPVPPRRKWKDRIRIVGARENNLKNLTVDVPLGAFTVITGISGSGKSTLVRKILYPAIGKLHGTAFDTAGKYDKLEGDFATLTQVEFIDQNPIGKSSRSNPISYVKAYDAIRQLYAGLPLSRQRNYQPATFSFNVEGGRCDACEGEGEIKVEMQFMADIYLTCESCRGQRFKQEVLDVTYEGKNIADVLGLTVEEALVFFQNKKQIADRIQPLWDVGLGYVQLGQSSNSLSGGEAQRVKLASFLGKNAPGGRVLFIFDEPTTGLHFHDIFNLLKSIQALVDEGHSVVVIEHNLEIIKCADWIIDLGPEAGEKNGGHLVFAGTPEDMIETNRGYTARFLRPKLLLGDKGA